MPEPIKYEFKTEEDRIKAIEALPDDPPPGVDVREWQNEQASLLDRIQQTRLFGEIAAAAVVTHPAAPVIAPPVEPAPTPDQEAIRRHNEALRADMEKMKQDSDEKLHKMQEEYEKKLLELKPKEVQALDDSETEKRIKTIRAEIGLKNEKMNTITDVFESDQYFRLSHGVQQLQNELIDLNEKRHRDTINIVKEFKTKAEQEAKLSKEQTERERLKELTEAKQRKFADNMNAFRGGHDELKGRNYNELEKDYVNFGREVGAVYFNKPAHEITEKEMEKAMAKYTAKTPAVLDGIASRGVRVPDGLAQYMLLSNVAMAMDGYELDPNTGAWRDLVNPNGNKVIMASFDDAYSYIKRKTGQSGKEILDKQKEAIDSYNKAANQRAGVTELGSEHQTREIDDMNKETAERIIQLTNDEDIVMRKRRNPSDPGVIQYEKAAKLLGFDPIPV
jgi:hypothetical protein